MENKKTLCWLSLGAGLGLLSALTFIFISMHTEKCPAGEKVRELLEEADKLLNKFQKSPRPGKNRQV